MARKEERRLGVEGVKKGRGGEVVGGSNAGAKGRKHR